MPPALQNPFVLWFVLTAALAAAAYFGVRKELRVRATLYGSFLLACLVALWPPYDRAGQQGKIRLGLDLKGGIHLVMQVVTDDALVATVDDAVQIARDQANRKGIVFAPIAARRRRPPSRSRASSPRASRTCATCCGTSSATGWDVGEPSPRGVSCVKMTEPFARQLRTQTVKEAIRTLERRVNQLGVAEPIIAAARREGRPDPGPAAGRAGRRAGQARHQADGPAQLKMVEDQAAQPRGACCRRRRQGAGQQGGRAGPGRDARPAGLLPGAAARRSSPGATSRTRGWASTRTTSPTSVHAEPARAPTSSSGETGANVGRQLAIVLDGNVSSRRPSSSAQISDEGQISGRFTRAGGGRAGQGAARGRAARHAEARCRS